MNSVISPRLLALVWGGGLIFMLIAAVVLRLVQRLPLFKPHFDAASFEESWCSGASSTGILWRLGWARSCLWVVVTDEALRIGVHFPFNLLLPNFLVGLDVSIPRSSLVSVEKSGPEGPAQYVNLSYTVSDEQRRLASSHALRLQVRSTERFVSLLKEKPLAARASRIG